MLILVAIILGANHAWQATSAEIPKTHVAVLDELLPKYLNDTSAYQNSISDLLFGDINTTEDTIENLDINVLNHNTLKKIINAEKDKYNNRTNHEYRRQSYQYYEKTLQDPRLGSIIKKAFQLMRQSIYHARYRLAETKLLRIKYKEDIPYNIGIIVANVYQLIQKCEHMYQQMVKWTDTYKKIFFLFHLILYEKILACNTDIEDLVRRAFVYQKHFEDARADKSKGNAGNSTGAGNGTLPGSGGSTSPGSDDEKLSSTMFLGHD